MGGGVSYCGQQLPLSFCPLLEKVLIGDVCSFRDEPLMIVRGGGGSTEKNNIYTSIWDKKGSGSDSKKNKASASFAMEKKQDQNLCPTPPTLINGSPLTKCNPACMTHNHMILWYCNEST